MNWKTKGEVMGEIGNAIRLLTILQSKGKAKSNYLADRLEVSERQIYRYIEQIQNSGIEIKSKRGRYGGFSLDRNQFINFNSINKKDIDMMELACQSLYGTNFPHKKEIEYIIEKLKAIASNNISKNQNNEILSEYYFVKEIHSNYETEYKKKLFDSIRSSINAREKFEILYDSNSSEKSYRKIHPYGIFSNKGDLYVVAYCEKRKELRNFKINRILDYEVLEEERFELKENFNIEKYANKSFGVFQDEKIHFKLKIHHPFSTIMKEKVFIKNEKIIDLDEETIIYEAEATGKTEIISWIISMKTYCEVLEPESFRDEIKIILKNMIKIYE
jgi:predicted DNA-binding transcriptional regulator YafY